MPRIPLPGEPSGKISGRRRTGRGERADGLGVEAVGRGLQHGRGRPDDVVAEVNPEAEGTGCGGGVTSDSGLLRGRMVSRALGYCYALHDRW